MLVYTGRHQGSRPYGASWPHPYGSREGEGHLRVENLFHCEGNTLFS